MRSLTCGLVGVISLMLGAALPGAAAPSVELLGNGGFEDAADGQARGWSVNNSGKLASVADAHTGRLAARFEAVPHEWGYSAMSATPVPLMAGALYRLSLWARGDGQVAFAVYQSSASGFIGSAFLTPDFNLTDQWQRLEVVYKPTDRRLKRGAFAVHLYGQGAVAFLDEASLSFNPEENLGLSLTPPRTPTTRLRFQVQTRQARAELFVNGQPVAIAGETAEAEAPEGLIAVAVKAAATGDNPGVSVRLLDHAETDGRWRMANKEENGWQTAGFDDSRWLAPATGAGDMMWSAAPTDRTVCLRQVLLWNETHYGPNRCLLPPVKEYGFPREGYEVLYLGLYSPLPYRLDGYEFVLEMPEAFQLLDMANYQPRHIDNNKPEKITTDTVQRDGMSYRRYRLDYPAGQVKPDQTQYSLLPLKMVGKVPGQKVRFYYRRAARGNFTELEQNLPVNLLPPVNGRMPRNVMISQYAPLGYSTRSPEALTARVQADLKAGCNNYVIGYSPWWGPVWQDTMKLLYQRATEGGARITIWMNYPLNYGDTYEGLAEYPTWIRQHEAAHGRYYRNEPAWGSGPGRYPYCNTYVLTPEGQEFWDVAQREYRRAADFFPKARLFFADWEFHNSNPDGSGVHCFCDRCRQAFAAYAKLPAGTVPTDEEIMKNYRVQWLAFRDQQDGQIQGKMAAVCHAVGCQYMSYSWAANMGFWQQCRGKLDVAFPGMPGNSTADSYLQKQLDGYAADLREQAGYARAVGQRFVFFRDNTPNGWQTTVLSDDGFVHPQSWKSQILRVVAALHGGIDLQCSDEFCAGMRYYLGEATRLISDFEPLFWEGERADTLAASAQIAYPDLLVLRRGNERLVLLFNEGCQPLRVTLENRELGAGQTATIYGTPGKVASPSRMAVTIPAEDVVAVHVQ